MIIRKLGDEVVEVSEEGARRTDIREGMPCFLCGSELHYPFMFSRGIGVHHECALDLCADLLDDSRLMRGGVCPAPPPRTDDGNEESKGREVDPVGEGSVRKARRDSTVARRRSRPSRGAA